MKTSITWRFNLLVVGEDKEDARRQRLDEHLDAVMEALVDLTDGNEDVRDPGISADMDTAEVEFGLIVNGTGAAALDSAQCVLRTAIHTAGGFTHDWDGTPTSAEPIEYSEPSVNLEPARA